MGETRPLRYFVDLGEETFAAREVTGRERISEPFRFEVSFALDGGLGEEPEALLMRGAVVRMEREGRHVRGIAGVVSEISESAAIRGAPEIHVVVEPQLAMLRHRTDTRIFRDKSVPEIVEEVLGRAGIVKGAEGPSGLSMLLTEPYDKRPHCVQYAETDLDFVHRLLEDEGIFYFFQERGGLVLGDNPGAYEPSKITLPFRGGLGMDAQEDAVIAVGRRAKASIGKVSLRDFDLEHPSLDLSASAEGPSEGGPEHYDYPGEYADPAVGKRKAALIAASHACAAAGFQGTEISGRVAPGHTLDIEGTPAGVADGSHVATSSEHAWKRDATGFSVAFESRTADTIFRPLRVTRSPLLLNPQTGFVTGPPGEDIHTDELGRVKVHFHWDRLQPYDDSCSHWIPVLQDNTGHSVGVPRVGWEVLVHFLEGDPDRPVVLGRVYNAEDNFPNPLPADKTKSALKSMSSPGRNGTNQIELDDKAGSERVTVLAEKDQNIVVANDKTTDVLHDEQIMVIRDEKVAVGHDQKEQIDGKFNHVIEGNQTRAVGGSRSREVTGSETSTIVKDRSITIGGMHQRRMGTDDIVQAKNLRETIGAVNLEAFIKTNTTTSGLLETLTVGGAHLEIAKGQKSEKTEKAQAETIGGLFFTKAGAGISAKAGQSRWVNVGGMMTTQATGKVVIDAPIEVTMSAGLGAVKGQGILLKVGESFVMLNDGVAVLSAKSTVKLDIAAKNDLPSPGFAIIPASYQQQQADKGNAAGDAAGAKGKGKTGSGDVSARGAFAKGADMVGAGPKGPAEKLAALKAAAAAGYALDPKHCNVSLMESARSYAEALGIRQGTDGQAIPLSGLANGMVGTLDSRAAAYGKATGADAAALRDQGLAWKSVTREEALAAANQGDFVVAGLENPGGHGHVATVVPGEGKKAGDGNIYPFVSGGGSQYGASDGSKTAGEVWSRGDRGSVKYYQYVPPDPPAPPAPAKPGGTSI